MSIAKLSIDLEARLAGLQAGLDKAGVLAEKLAARMDATFGGLRSTLGGIGGALGAAFSVGAFATWLRSTTDGIDKLNDLSDATGATVENLSALEDVAVRTGTSLDTAGDAVLKLNRALNEASNPNSDAAKAIDALGLSVEGLKRLDPVEALQKVGVALAGFANDGNKGRIVMELLGKSTREIAPLLKDLAEAGQLVATVTEEEAKQAEKFNKELFALEKIAIDTSRAIAGPMISAINETIAVFREGKKEGKGFFETLWLGTRLLTGQDGGGATGSWEDETPKPTLPNTLTGGTKPPRGRATPRTSADRPGVAGPPLDPLEAFRLLEREGQAATDAALRVATLTDIENKRADALKLVADQQKRLDDLLASTPSGKEAERLQNVLLINQAFDAGKITLGEWVELTALFDETLENAGKTAKDVGDEIGLVFASAAGDAIAHWEGVRAVLKGVLADLAQIVLKKTFTEPAGNAIGGLLSNIDWGSIIGSAFGSAKGNAFNAQGLVAFAGGGVIDSPTLFGYGRGRAGVMGEAGPEGILPLKRGRDGKLGVQSQGGGMTVVFNLAAGTTADDFRRSQRQIEAELGRTMRRAGAIA